MAVLPRIPEPEVMATMDEAVAYDAMDHSAVNEQFVSDYLACFSGNVPNGRVGAGWSRDAVVDLGTGTAQIPLALVRRAGPAIMVLACDLSAAMLRIAARNVRKAGRGTQVRPLLCSSRQLPFPDAGCHHVISNSLIHHIPNPIDVFREVARIAAPGALLYFRDLLRPGDAVERDTLVEMHAGDATSFQRQMFRESLQAALTLTELRHILQAAGLSPDGATQTSDRHWTWVGRR